jgi:hypothetical protein
MKISAVNIILEKFHVDGIAYSLEKLLFGLWCGYAHCLLCQFQYSNELWQEVLIEAYRKSVCSHY